MEIEDVKKVSEAVDKEKVMSMFNLLKEKKYFSFLKAFLIMLWGLYGKYLKGKSVTIKGKKIPLTALIIACVGIYAIMPSSNEKDKISDEKRAELKMSEENSYDKNGLKIYNWERCNQGICGMMENNSNKTLDRVVISVTFDDRQKNVLAEGSIEAKKVEPGYKAKLNITSDVDFYGYTLRDVTVE